MNLLRVPTAENTQHRGKYRCLIQLNKRPAIQWTFPLSLSEDINIPVASVRLVSSLIGLDFTKQQNILLFVCTETSKFKQVKQEARGLSYKDFQRKFYATTNS